MDAPVMGLDFLGYKIAINYSYWHIGQEIAVVFFGVFSNTLAFLFLITVCHLSQKYIFCFPKRFC